MVIGTVAAGLEAMVAAVIAVGTAVIEATAMVRTLTMLSVTIVVQAG